MYFHTAPDLVHSDNMMTSSNGTIFRVTGLLCIHRSPVNPRTKAIDAELWFLICAWINLWVNNREAGDLRRHHAHYDVIVMCYTNCERHEATSFWIFININLPCCNKNTSRTYLNYNTEPHIKIRWAYVLCVYVCVCVWGGGGGIFVMPLLFINTKKNILRTSHFKAGYPRQFHHPNSWANITG